MCDTLVSLPHYTQNGNLIFAKNSDREPDEAHEILHAGRAFHKNRKLSCTYIEIPQVAETYEVILSKPFHMWGAEMGVNEFGLVIGNEAVFTNVKINKGNTGLTGMDLLRLALERSASAREAIHCITGLLDIYGQDTCGGYQDKNFFYHNSYIIADAREAFVLETAGKSWALKEIHSFGSISNGLSIGTDFDEIHLVNEKRNFPFNFKKKPKPFSFSKHFSDFLYTKVGRAKTRKSCSMALIETAKGNLDIEKTIAILKTHNILDPEFEPKKANTASLCMHATGMTNPSQTTGSMVAEIRSGLPSTIWLTASSMPCLSVYMPFFMATKTLDDLLKPGPHPDDSLWWKAEKVHRWVCQDYQNRKEKLQASLGTMQKEFIQGEKRLMDKKADYPELEKFSTACLRKVMDFYESNLT